MTNKFSNSIRASLAGAIALTMVSVTTPARAGNDLVEGVVGGFFGAALLNELQKQQEKQRRKNQRAKANPTVKEIQSLLNNLGYPAGTPDGLYGKKTGSALTSFMADYGSSYDGKADGNELAMLRQAKAGTIARVSTRDGGSVTDLAAIDNVGFTQIPPYINDYVKTYEDSGV